MALHGCFAPPIAVGPDLLIIQFGRHGGGFLAFIQAAYGSLLISLI
jgi:hypothetical protein